MNNFKNLRGTVDLLPDQLIKWQNVEKIIIPSTGSILVTKVSPTADPSNAGVMFEKAAHSFGKFVDRVDPKIMAFPILSTATLAASSPSLPPR